MIESYKNLDVLLHIAAVDLLEEDYAYAESIDTSETTISDKTKRKVLRRIRRYDSESVWSELPIVVKRMVASVLIVCTLSFAMCMSVKAVREEIVNTVLEWYDKFVAIFYVAETEPPRSIEEYKEPLLSIAGAEKVVALKGETSYQILYTHETVTLMLYQQEVISETSQDVDSESDCTQIHIKINGVDALLFIYDDERRTLTWHDDSYSYTIYTFTKDIDINTLNLIAESVQ